jgi:H+/Cl- antiporter ClcA
VPGGLFAPSLSVGAGIGYNVSTLLGYGVNTGIIAMGMTAFLAAVTQAPLTAFIIVMEMIDGRPMVLSLMAVAMVAATISRMISRPLYETLSKRMLDNYRAKVASAAPPQELPAPAAPSPEAATTPPEPSSPQTPPVPPSS